MHDSHTFSYRETVLVEAGTLQGLCRELKNKYGLGPECIAEVRRYQRLKKMRDDEISAQTSCLLDGRRELSNILDDSCLVDEPIVRQEAVKKADEELGLSLREELMRSGEREYVMTNPNLRKQLRIKIRDCSYNEELGIWDKDDVEEASG